MISHIYGETALFDAPITLCMMSGALKILPLIHGEKRRLALPVLDGIHLLLMMEEKTRIIFSSNKLFNIMQAIFLLYLAN